METNQAAEHLQVIRTLMERSALYRRALAPIMTYCGVLGVVAGVAGWLMKINSGRSFVMFWNAVAMLAISGAFLLVRRQALKDAEPFWSSPTKQVAKAVLPPLVVGMFTGLWIFLNTAPGDSFDAGFLVVVWSCLYGCALHSAGFFVSRGFRLFGWIFIILGCVLMTLSSVGWGLHLLMGVLFGGLHLAYGIYLYFTENKKSTP